MTAGADGPFDWQPDPERAGEAVTPAAAYAIARLGSSGPGRLLGWLSWLLAPIGWLLKGPLLLLIQLYKRLLSPLLPPACRFEPSCSVYVYQALQTHGFIRGGLLGLLRLLRCQPFCTAGYDPVPPDPCALCSEPEGEGL